MTRKDNEARSNALSRRHFITSSAAAVAGASTVAIGQIETADAQSINCAPVSGSVAWKQPGNNEHIRTLGRAAKRASDGTLVIDYFGHCAFRLTTPAGLTLLFDPWRNDPSGAWGLWFPKDFPRVAVDAALSTHAHFDHDAVDRVDATCILDRMVGTYSFADVSISGVADKHATDAPGWYKWIDVVKEFGADPYPPNNPGHLDMSSFVVETAGIRTLIWGDNRANPPEEVWSAWGRIDVLTIPVDGSEHILSIAQANAIVERLKPKVIIPTHYLMRGISTTLTTLQTAEAWVNQQAKKRRLDTPRLALTADGIRGLDREFFYFKDMAHDR